MGQVRTYLSATLLHPRVSGQLFGAVGLRALRERRGVSAGLPLFVQTLPVRAPLSACQLENRWSN